MQLVDYRPLPAPLMQYPMTLRPTPPVNGYGALWYGEDWDEDDMYAWLPVPRSRFVIAGAILGAAAAAYRGSASARSLTLGAAAGVGAVTLLSALTTRD